MPGVLAASTSLLYLMFFVTMTRSQLSRSRALTSRNSSHEHCIPLLQVFILKKQLRESESNFGAGVRERGGGKPMHTGGRGMGPLPGPPGGNPGRDPGMDRMSGFKRMR